MQTQFAAASRTCFGIAKGETSPLLDSKGKAFCVCRAELCRGFEGA